jgi:hypothetical protein
MANPSGTAPEESKPIPGATLSLFAVALVELRKDLRQLIDSRWNEAVRRRAEELSSTLGQACQRMGLVGLQPFLRSLTNLTRVPRADALLLLPALREKFEVLGREVEARLPRRTRRFRS